MANANSTPTHIDDVVSYFNCCSDSFGQIAAVLKVIEKEAADHSSLKKLARAGYTIAMDMENIADCWREEIKDNGVRKD